MVMLVRKSARAPLEPRTRVDKTLAVFSHVGLAGNSLLEVRNRLGGVDRDAELELGGALNGAIAGVSAGKVRVGAGSTRSVGRCHVAAGAEQFVELSSMQLTW